MQVALSDWDRVGHFRQLMLELKAELQKVKEVAQLAKEVAEAEK